MNTLRRNCAAAMAAASILLGFGSVANALDQVQQCKTETGDFYVLGYGTGGRAAHCKRRESCLVKVIEGRCQEFFGCKLEWRISYGECKDMASKAPSTKVPHKLTPEKAERPATKSSKVPPTGGIQRN